MSIGYVDSDHTSLEEVRPLWERLRDHHATLSVHFAEQIARNTYDDRVKALLERAESGFLKVILVQEGAADTLVGYGIASMDQQGQGEIDSLYVLEEYRGCGVGHELMERMLRWLGGQGVHNIGISVLFGNEQVFRFYAKYGFYPRAYLLKQKGS